MILNPFHSIDPILMLVEGSANISGTFPLVDGSTNITDPSFLDMFLTKLVEVAGILFASVLILIVVFVLLHFFGWLVRVMGRKWGKVKILIDTTPGDSSELNRIYMALVNRNNQFRYLLQALPPLWLLTIADVKISRLFQAPNPNRETVNIKIGPAEVKRAEQLLNRLFSWGHIYKLQMFSSDGNYYLSMDSRSGIELYLKLENFDEDLEQAVTQILAITGTRGGASSPENKELVAGLLTMSRFFVSPFKTEFLRNAIEHFDRASVWSSMRIKAQLLSLCSLQLSQSSPTETKKETQKRIAMLQKDPSILKQFHSILNYQSALAEFYTYRPDGYKESKKLFSQIKKPRFFTKLRARLGMSPQKRKLLLYLLAQTNLAIVIAHITTTNKKEQDSLDQELKETLRTVEQSMSSFGYSGLGSALKDVYWRLLNAQICQASIRHESNEEMIARAHQALSIAPYALDVKANLGNLLKLEATKLEDERKRNEYIKEAQNIFIELAETGWDPGYVHYRLAEIYYIQGDRTKALEHVEKASDPSVRDVYEPLDELADLIKTQKKSKTR